MAALGNSLLDLFYVKKSKITHLFMSLFGDGEGHFLKATFPTQFLTVPPSDFHPAQDLLHREGSSGQSQPCQLSK